MEELLQDRIGKSNNQKNISKPVFFDISNSDHLKEMNELLENNRSILVCDFLESQLEELIKIRNPRIQYTTQEISIQIQAITSNNLREYGKWVYYPWLNKLVHILDEKEFIEVRTNRNRNKLTVEEQQTLLSKKVGVVGLSVGKTISITMAMERSCGELRLADYDDLELSNLNRLQTGIQNLGLPKTVIATREILEIDPYLNVVCYHDGLTTENMDSFFTKGGNLDLVVDECDGLDIKILLRKKAKELRIPVIMDMNDRGTLDVERFDLEPERPFLHGMIDHLDLDRIKDLNNLEKIPYILPMLGEETISSKLKASMLEMGFTLNTWPQLSSSVVLGGAIAADTYRRIMLGQFTKSGRYWVDTEDIMLESEDKVNVDKINVQPIASNDSENNAKWVKFIKECVNIDEVRNWTIESKDKILTIEFHPLTTVSDFNYDLMDCLNAGLIIGSMAELNENNTPNFNLNENILEIDISQIKNTAQPSRKNSSLEKKSNVNLKKVLDDLEINYALISEEKLRKKFSEILAKTEKVKHLNRTWSHIYLNHIHNSSKLNANSGAVSAFLNLSNDPEVVDLLNDWNGGDVFQSIYQNEFSIDKSYLIVSENISGRDNIVNLGVKLLKIINEFTRDTNELISVQSLPLLLSNGFSENGISESVKEFNKKELGITSENLQPVFICRILR